ncbi:RHS repeat-associated core domain [Serratia quinivorans]|uniref:RHS repeat-associated core domain-containing protein n=1 Tax=Serratia quinivorans TaxID=137545 RepID=UPI00217C6883|nr:RHS repeat-associated core domain-containing protein [Serratia quinivorans]CAI1566705.1 RHS repeat-associated core domain [Serratia quinivorans]CAI1696513.1 RHS repeat-associated core domain [Serratia quinivorans]
MEFFHTATNSLNTVFENNSFSTGKKQTSNYNAWGDTQRDAGEFTLGFNGERSDPLTGVTHLGNGYRAYNPVLMRFNAPDSWSPFGDGGINCYAYCEGDPVNNTDPNGHSHNKATGGIYAGVLAIVIGLASGGIAIAASSGIFAIISALGVIAGGSYAISLGLTAIEQDKEAQANAPYELFGPEEEFGGASLKMGIASVVAGVASMGGSIYGRKSARKARKAKKQTKTANNRLPKGKRMESQIPDVEYIGERKLGTPTYVGDVTHTDLSDISRTETVADIHIFDSPQPSTSTGGVTRVRNNSSSVSVSRSTSNASTPTPTPMSTPMSTQTPTQKWEVKDASYYRGNVTYNVKKHIPRTGLD